MTNVRLTFYPIGDSYWIVAVAALVLFGLLALGPARGKVSRGRRAVLAGLRLLAIVALILAMLRPTLLYTRTTKQPATLVILADRSRSMSVPDEIDGKSRWDAQRRALDDARRAIRDLAKEFEVKAYTFDAETHPAEVSGGQVQLADPPGGQQTAIGAVLEDVLREQAGKLLLGVVLLSDGAQRAYPPRDVLPQTAASRLKYLGYPLYTVRFGQARGLGQARDVAVKEMVATEQVFVKNELTVTGQIRADGYVNHDIPVRLLFETSPGKLEPVAQEVVHVNADGELLSVKLTYAPQVPGEYKVVLDAASQPGELVTTNNQLSTFVHVLKGGLKVLYLEGTPRYEQRFLRRSLDASRDFRVDYVRLDAQQPETRPEDLSDRLKPGKYDVYILGDLDANAFPEKDLRDLAEAVARGAGLIMLGGFHSFGPGGYAKTPLADVLPVKMSDMERQAFGDPLASDLHLSGPLKMRPTPLGLSHFALMLAPDRQENLRLWAQLPPLDGANRFRAPKPGALLLAEAAKDQPLLLAHQFDNGRVMAFAGDTTWHWCMRGFEAAHKRFWRQAVLWLARKDESLEGSVWIKLAQRRFAPNQRVEFSVGARSAGGEPIQGASYRAEATLPDGSKRPVQVVQSDKEAAGSLRETKAAGDYTIHVWGMQGGQEIGTTQARFSVYEEDLELDNAAADATLLDSLAAMTNGQSLPPEELPKLIQRLAQETGYLDVQTETKETLWDTWPFFLVLVGLLTAEWYLRKRWSLV